MKLFELQRIKVVLTFKPENIQGTQYKTKTFVNICAHFQNAHFSVLLDKDVNVQHSKNFYCFFRTFVLYS